MKRSASDVWDDVRMTAGTTAWLLAFAVWWFYGFGWFLAVLAGCGVVEVLVGSAVAVAKHRRESRSEVAE